MTVDPSAQLTYLENLPFVVDAQGGVSGRIYGARAGAELADGKSIHAVLAASFERVCRIASAERPRRLILHNGYFLPPSDLLLPLGRMLTGATDCRHVTVTVMTNSRETMDVNSVNTFGRYVMLALSEHIAERRDPARAARFEYYEMARPPGTPLRTLHSKVWVLGDEIFVGSANADLRSFMMDSNNGILIRNAPDLVARYEAMVDGLVEDTVYFRNATGTFGPSARAAFAAEDAETLRKGAARFGLGSGLTAQQWQALEKNFAEAVGLAYTLTRKALAGGADGRAAGERYDRYFKLF
jgi:phosphatidylserine/phosphatidylglycerophosphate/cardiolipin synthase-like enzyme